MTPEHRTLRARAAALAMHSRHGAAVTEAGRQAFLSRFEREVDPDLVLPEAERARRADLARRSYMLRLALRSVQARARRKARAS